MGVILSAPIAKDDIPDATTYLEEKTSEKHDGRCRIEVE